MGIQPDKKDLWANIVGAALIAAAATLFAGALPWMPRGLQDGTTIRMVLAAGVVIIAATLLAYGRLVRRRNRLMLKFRSESALRILLCTLVGDNRGSVTERLATAIDRRFGQAVILHRLPEAVPLPENVFEFEGRLRTRSDAAAAYLDGTDGDLVVFGDYHPEAGLLELHFRARGGSGSREGIPLELTRSITLSDKLDETVDAMLVAVVTSFCRMQSHTIEEVEELERLVGRIEMVGQDQRISQRAEFQFYLGNLLERSGIASGSVTTLQKSRSAFEIVLASAEPLSRGIREDAQASLARCLSRIGLEERSAAPIRRAVKLLGALRENKTDGIPANFYLVCQSFEAEALARLSNLTSDSSMVQRAVRLHRQVVEAYAQEEDSQNWNIARLHLCSALQFARQLRNAPAFLVEALDILRDLGERDLGNELLAGDAQLAHANIARELGLEQNDAALFNEAFDVASRGGETFTKMRYPKLHADFAYAAARAAHGLSYRQGNAHWTPIAVERYLEVVKSGERDDPPHARGDLHYYAGCKLGDLAHLNSAPEMMKVGLAGLDTADTAYAAAKCLFCRCKTRLSITSLALGLAALTGDVAQLDAASEQLDYARQLVRQRKLKCTQHRKPPDDNRFDEGLAFLARRLAALRQAALQPQSGRNLHAVEHDVWTNV